MGVFDSGYKGGGTLKKLLTVYIFTTVLMVLCVFTSAYSMVIQYQMYGFEYVKHIEINGVSYSETVNLGSLFIGFLTILWLTCVCYRVYYLEKSFDIVQKEEQLRAKNDQ